MPRPVPILLSARSLGHGGGERQLAITALSVDRSRFIPHVASAEGGFWEALFQQAGIPMHRIRSRSLLSRRGVSEMTRLRSFITEHGIRLVQTFDYAVNVYAIPVARSIPGVKPVSNLRCHMNLIPPRDRKLNYLSHQIASAVVVNSEALRDHLIEDYRIDTRKIFVCHNGLDTAVFRPGVRKRLEGLEDRSLVIGVTCVLRPEKNLPLLLEAFATVRLNRPGLALLIVGSGPEEQSLRALAERLQLGDSCIFQPSTKDVAPWLRSTDVFVLPSRTEGLSNSIMEAMACECCVIASKVGGTPELIADGVTGLLFPSEDRAALCRALETVIDNPEKRTLLARAAALRMQSQFSLQASVNCMQDIYDRILNPRRRRR